MIGSIFLTSRSFFEPTNFLTIVSSIDEFNGKEPGKAMEEPFDPHPPLRGTAPHWERE